MAAPLLLLVALARAGEVVRVSRVAMGTVVGVNVRTEDPVAARAHADGAFAAVERWEGLLSEWRPDSLTSRAAATGGPVALPPEARALFEAAATLRAWTNGAFDVAWKGGRVLLAAEGLRVEPAGSAVGLGGVLKGFLAERAAEALREAGEAHFLVDAAGDVVARGDLDRAGAGWPVDLPAFGRTVHLRDAALSSSGDAEQPGHIVDPRTGAPVTCTRAVAVVAPEGTWADGLATAIFASCDEALAERAGAVALRMDAEGRVHATRGAGRVFRRR